METEDRKEVNAPIVETFWRGVERHLVRGGFTDDQAREVVHIMAYMMPQYVREQTDALGDKIAKQLTNDNDRLRTDMRQENDRLRADIHKENAAIRAEISKDNAELRATISDKNSTRMLSDHWHPDCRDHCHRDFGGQKSSHLVLQ